DEPATNSKNLTLQRVPWILRIVDENENPIAGAMVSINGLRTVQTPSRHWEWPGSKFGAAPSATSNDDGSVQLWYPSILGSEPNLETVDFLSVAVLHDHFVGVQQDFSTKPNARVSLERGVNVEFTAFDSRTTVP
ncbi:unnamed protein product, partial [Hapterophycus canaliculatus]